MSLPSTPITETSAASIRHLEPEFPDDVLHVALGSLEVSLSASYDGNAVDRAAVTEGLGDLLKQFDVLFADYK